MLGRNSQIRTYTNRRARVHKFLRVQNLPTPCPLPQRGRFFSRGWQGGRDARVPSVARAGSASVSLARRQRCAAWQRREQARPQKTYPSKPLVKGGEGRGEEGFESSAFTNFGCAVGIIPTALPEFAVPLAKRGGTAPGFGYPCDHGEP